MNQNDIDLKKTAVQIGISMLIFLLLFYTLFPLFELLVEPLASALAGEWLGNVISRITLGVIYAIVFIVPARLFMRLSKNKDKRLHRAATFPSKNAVFIIMATVAITIACAYVNSWLGTIFGVPNAPAAPAAPVSLIDFLLLTFTTALVPAFCEEFLFRKTILRALLPYGEGFAIISSALLFGLMHQNIFQIFYTTMAGIVLGYVYAKTRSYLCVFLIHFVNNFVSVLQTAFSNNLGEPYKSICIVSLTATVLVLGAVSVIVLVQRERKEKDVYATGSFGQLLRPSSDFVLKDTSSAPAKILFLSPCVMIFTILSVLTCVLQFFS